MFWILACLFSSTIALPSRFAQGTEVFTGADLLSDSRVIIFDGTDQIPENDAPTVSGTGLIFDSPSQVDFGKLFQIAIVDPRSIPQNIVIDMTLAYRRSTNGAGQDLIFALTDGENIQGLQININTDGNDLLGTVHLIDNGAVGARTGLDVIGGTQPPTNPGSGIFLTARFEVTGGIASGTFDLNGFAQTPNIVFDDLMPSRGLSFAMIRDDDENEQYNVEFLAISQATCGLNGDYNSDCDVDGTDFLTWQSGLSSEFLDQDLQIWRDNYGANGLTPVNATQEPSVISPIPEPNSLLLLVVCVIAFTGIRDQS